MQWNAVNNVAVYLIDDDFDHLWTADVTIKGDGPVYDGATVDSAARAPLQPGGLGHLRLEDAGDAGQWGAQ